MARTDFYHDPAAPPANSLVPSTTVAVRDEQGRLLLIHRIDNDRWALPGGAMELGESVAEGAVREVEEETGITARLTGLVGIYTDPGHVMQYGDGEVRQQFSVCFHGVPVSGAAREDGSETKEVRWVDPADISALNIHPSMRKRIERALARITEPQIT